MKKTLITSVTAFAVVLSAGMSMAGPLGDHGLRGQAHDARSAVSQALNNADRMANTHQTTKMTDRGVDLLAEQDVGEENLISAQETSLYGSTPQYSLEIEVSPEAKNALEHTDLGLWVIKHQY
ncbi:hypothetical protein D1823_14470 [Ruegeria sp. AD91A]|uniref:hypothetical protein n=1 Tax=Ruegeria sp. AD91A TaxID=2293862 RepID=UPI000E513E6B|nr:hypothetical protein [Ruegeria sp. AD91A]AXT27662.1 hypothetical protein D1823_14470 [Ruegeria sp. AD91A]